MLHVMELADVSFLGKKCKKMMQNSSSSSDGGDVFAFKRLTGGVAFVGVAFFFGAFAAFSAIAADFVDDFSSKTAIFSGEVSSVLPIAWCVPHSRNDSILKITSIFFQPHVGNSKMLHRKIDIKCNMKMYYTHLLQLIHSKN